MQSGETFVHQLSCEPLRDETGQAQCFQATSVVLWTRVTTDAGDLAGTFQLARDDAFTEMVLEGAAVATADADHTVKLIPTGLTPGTTYYYRFVFDGAMSPVGRTRRRFRKTRESLVCDVLGAELVNGTSVD